MGLRFSLKNCKNIVAFSAVLGDFIGGVDDGSVVLKEDEEN